MSKLLIIGNGFDLHLGIKSKFSDYYEWYLNEQPELETLSNQLNDLNQLLYGIEIRQDKVDKINDTLKSITNLKDINIWLLILHIKKITDEANFPKFNLENWVMLKSFYMMS